MVAFGSPLVSLNHQKSLIRDRIREVASGQVNGIYLHGRPGSSKTYLVKTTLESLNHRYAYSNGHLTPIGLFDLIEENPHATIVLDDVSSIFAQPKALQILLAALGNPHDGSRVRLVRHKTATKDRTAYFEGSIIAISNLQLAAHENQVLEALVDRVHVMAFEPSDEEIEAAILEIVGTSPMGVPASEAREVATFVLEQCREAGVRPSIRLFVDKAMPDYVFWKGKNSESDWRDLVRSSIRQMVIPQQHKLRDMTKRDRMAQEKNIAVQIFTALPTRKERIAEWGRLTGKSQTAFYRHVEGLSESRVIEAF